MTRMIAAGMLALGAIFGAIGTVSAQMDAVIISLNRCADPTRAAESRIRDCMVVINALGVDQDEVAFAWLDLGLVYQSQGGDRQRELEAYSKAIALQPDLWQARANRAGLYLQAGEGEKALADYLAMRQAGPDKVPLWRAKTNLEYRTAQIDGSTTNRSNMDSPGREQAGYANMLDVLGRALQTGFANRCRQRALAGLELDAARKDCDAALQVNSADEIAHHARGVVEFRLADWTAALAEFNTVLSSRPNAAESLYMKGIVERRMGNAPSGDTDIAAARVIDATVENSYARFGIQP